MTMCVLATGNRHKLAELGRMLDEEAIALEVVAPRRFGEPPEIPETGDSFVANAVLKARGLAAWLRAQDCPGDALVLADDSGISVDAFDGAPGVISARFAGEPSDDAANNRKLVDELRARGLEASAAHYSCVLALVRVDGGVITREGDDLVVFDGRWDVEVRTAARGEGGFGYDPHAWIDGGTRTVAELDAGEKAAVSHRGRALRELVQWWLARA